MPRPRSPRSSRPPSDRSSWLVSVNDSSIDDPDEAARLADLQLRSKLVGRLALRFGDASLEPLFLGDELHAVQRRMITVGCSVAALGLLADFFFLYLHFEIRIIVREDTPSLQSSLAVVDDDSFNDDISNGTNWTRTVLRDWEPHYLFLRTTTEAMLLLLLLIAQGPRCRRLFPDRWREGCYEGSWRMGYEALERLVAPVIVLIVLCISMNAWRLQTLIGGQRSQRASGSVLGSEFTLQARDRDSHI